MTTTMVGALTEALARLKAAEEREEQWRKGFEAFVTEARGMIGACSVRCGKTPYPCPLCVNIMKLLAVPGWPHWTHADGLSEPSKP